MENLYEGFSDIIKRLKKETEELVRQNDRLKDFLDARGLREEFEAFPGHTHLFPGTGEYQKEAQDYLRVCAERRFREDQLDVIRAGFDNGLGIEGVSFYTYPWYSAELMNEIRLGLRQTGILAKLPGEYQDLLTKIWNDGGAGRLNPDQISVLREMIVAQYPIEDIEFCVDPQYPIDPIEDIEFCIDEFCIDQPGYSFNFATLRELKAAIEEGLNIRYLDSYEPGDIHALRLEVESKGLAALVQEDPFALAYVKEQTPEICMAAVKQKGAALRFVKNQTPEICLAAVRQFGYALEFVKEQTPEICCAAVDQLWDSLRFVKDLNMVSEIVSDGNERNENKRPKRKEHTR